MLDHYDSMKFYFDYINSKFDNNVNLYKIRSWTEISKQIYELEVSNISTDIEKLKRRKELLVSILGYHIYYPKNMALLCLYNVANSNNKVLFELENFKKELRKRYVYNTDKHFLRIHEENLPNYSESLKNIDLNLISADYMVLSNNQELCDDTFSMIYFNKLHFPDPNINAINKEIQILNQNGIINNKNLVRRLNL